ncbi:MAG: RraA family protein [Oscillospiraceae bacterium]|nr:RraA family protein [Oscillospiraceae bacterium]
MFFSTREEVIKMTPMWKGERMDDGRPMVPESTINRMRKMSMTMEEVWGLSWASNYEFLVEGDLRATHSTDKPLIGRALTINCLPFREDLDSVTKPESEAFGFVGHYNKAAVDRLVKDDVMVVDFYGKVEYGTFFGGNLSTTVARRTQGGGVVIWGGIRDLDQVKKIENLQIYYRGAHPTAIRDYVMTGYNRPTLIGGAVCMPGDIVFGSSQGVVFIPSHLVEETVESAEKSHIRDEFGFERLREQRYTATAIDSPWTDEMNDDFLAWFASSPKTQEYQYLNFKADIERQKRGEPNPFMKRARQGLAWNP